MTAAAVSPAVSGLVISGLRKSFGTHEVLAGIDLDVPAGSLTAILGPSGSGKTTLLRVIAGFDSADHGTVTVDGLVVEGSGRPLPSDRRHIAYVPQEGALFPHLSVAANVGFAVPRAERASRVRELLELVGMRDFGRRYPHELSGGEQQRVALARALAVRPSVVLLDEPFSALDAGLRSVVRQDVARILGEAGATALLVTHDQDEALSVATHVAVIRDGRIAQYGTPLDIYHRPADADVARFVGAANLLDGVARGGRAVTRLGAHSFGSASFAEGSAIVVLVRPEQLELLEPGHHDFEKAGAEWVVGVVASIDFHGHDTVLDILLSADDPTPIRARIPGAPTVAPGAQVKIRPGVEATLAWTVGD
jgi:iron(III) transport system ATP-binding protein